MAAPRYDVLGIGNAIVDVLAQADDAFLIKQGLAKGAMTLIDDGTADRLYKAMGPAIECSGGSAANTIAALASLGSPCAFIGKVRNDALGKVFAHDIRALGVAFDTPPAKTGPSTARCLVLVTPDAQRTMQTFLGASSGLTADDIDPAVVADAQVTYLEGYLWDPLAAKEAFIKAARLAHDAGRKVALTLSDSFCVDRHRADFLKLIEGHVDVLFANEAEIKALYQVADFDLAVRQARHHCEVAAVTRSEKGAVIVVGDQVTAIPAASVARVVDTTGAGDLYAAGFLFGYTRDLPIEICGKIGAIAAAEIISHYGARPDANLADLVAAKLGPLPITAQAAV